MDFETPPKAKLWKNKKSYLFRNWLNKQIKLDEKDWDANFKEYIDVKLKEAGENAETEKSAEQKREDTFERYLEGLDLTRWDLEGKRIMDAGCNDGEFVIACIEKEITNEIYGLDEKLVEEARNEKYSRNFFSGDFTQEFPVKNFDYVVSAAAISLFFNEREKSKAEAAIKNALESLKEGGELRIWPVFKAMRGDLAGIEEEEIVAREIIEKLEKDLGVVCELRYTDIAANGTDKDVWAEQVLIIKV